MCPYGTDCADCEKRVTAMPVPVPPEGWLLHSTHRFANGDLNGASYSAIPSAGSGSYGACQNCPYSASSGVDGIDASMCESEEDMVRACVAYCDQITIRGEGAGCVGIFVYLDDTTADANDGRCCPLWQMAPLSSSVLGDRLAFYQRAPLPP